MQQSEYQMQHFRERVLFAHEIGKKDTIFSPLISGKPLRLVGVIDADKAARKGECLATGNENRRVDDASGRCDEGHDEENHAEDSKDYGKNELNAELAVRE